MYLVDIVQDFQNCQDASSNEQTHLSPDVTWEQRKQLLLAALDTQTRAYARPLSARRQYDLN